MTIPSNIAKLRERNRSIRGGNFQYEDAEWMRDSYWIRRLTLRQMAEEASCSLRTIARWMELHGIPTEDRKPRRTRIRRSPKTCPVCGITIGDYSQACKKHGHPSGPSSHRWRGGEASYVAAHQRVRSARGRASTYPCAHCIESPARHWSYNHRDPNEIWGPDKPGRKDRPYSLNPDFYDPLCVSCHKHRDMAYIKENR